MARVGPVVLEAEGDQYLGGGRIATVLWTGTLANGNKAVLRHVEGGELLWEGEYPAIVGGYLGPNGIHFENGFHVDTLDAGKLLIYLHEAI